MISLAKRSAVDALSSVGWLSGQTRPERCHQERLLIVTFHRVLPELERAQYPYPGLVVTPSELSFCLGYFAQHYQVDLLSRQHARMRAGQRSAKPLLAITFDDGQWDNLVHAEPVLCTHRLNATFYIPTQAVERAELIWHDQLGYAVLAALSGQCSPELRALFARNGLELTEPSAALAVELAKTLAPGARAELVSEAARIAPRPAPSWGRLMNWSEVRTLAERGHEIGSHSVTHELMPQLDDAALAHESSASKHQIEAAIGARVSSYCYPNGSSDARCERAVARAGYENAVTTRWGANGHTEPAFALKRCDIDARALRDAGGHLSRKRLAFRLSGHYPGLRG